MSHEPINRGEGHGRVEEHFASLRERHVRGDRDAYTFVSFGDELEEALRSGLIAAHVIYVVENEQVEPVELLQFLR